MNSRKQPDHRVPLTDTAKRISRRDALRLGAGALAGVAFAPNVLAAAPTRLGIMRRELIQRRIPRSGEEIPVIGLGTWQTFMVDESEAERAPLREVLRIFYEEGGRVLDSSPMYDPAESVTGDIASEMGLIDDLWVATKVWTEGEAEGRAQMAQSLSELRRPSIELMQVHNLLDADIHLATLEEMKAAGTIRYIGITTSSARQYDAVEALLDDDRIDFLQVNYSIGERESADRVLPKARDRGIAVMINRPFGGGELFPMVSGRALPDWAAEFDCTAWSQFFLKYVVSHPAVTCAIPATSNPNHQRENMGGGTGRLPDEQTRRRMEALIDSLG